MAGFDDLPNELVSEVLKFVLPEDLENFAQTSKHVLLLSKPFLETHRQLIRRYTIFHSYPPPGQDRDTWYEDMETHRLETRDGFSVGPLPNLFKEILNQPRVGHYVRKVELDHLLNMHPDIIRNNNSDEAQGLYKRQGDLIDAAVAQSDVPEVRDQYECLKDNRPNPAYGGEELLISLILPLLPNLNRLSMQWSGDSYVRKTMHHRATSITGISWLANLKTVRLEAVCYGSLGFEDLKLFNSLPTLKSLTASAISDSSKTLEFLPDSHTTELVLLSCNVTMPLLISYLTSFRDLQSVTYKCTPDLLWLFPRHDIEQFDPDSFRSSLVAHGKATLQTLTVLGMDRVRPDCFMGSLHAFEALTQIHTEWSFLFPGGCDLEAWPSHVLPAKLFALKVHDKANRSIEEYKTFIRGIERAKENTCMHLATVDVEIDWYGDHMTEQLVYLNSLFKEVGLSLVFK
ncbi:hypothetical protein IMSHALPRED_008936 [Imshaugia aleurites]|uniref:F-box domain-containing protein n=1 Tax=Imshaugia aleurites TaxID=172621 RepID=A0A8H3FX05_9LECA|nr:hypothetical protein IMSHALPRED_008936 [Imshaugia aleurites]